MILKLKESGLKCGIVETNYASIIRRADYSHFTNNLQFDTDHQQIDIIVMPFYDGDLSSLSPELIEFKFDHKIELMIKITDQVFCLFKTGFCYTDLKYQNIFFKCHSKDNFTVHLGDMGGMKLCGNKNSTCTFPSFISRYTEGYVANNNTVVWGLLMVFLNMFTKIDTIYKFSTSQIDKLTSKQILQIIMTLHTTENDKAIVFIYNCAAQLMESDLSIYEFESELHKLM